MGTSTAFKAWAHTFDITRRAEHTGDGLLALHGCDMSGGEAAVVGGSLPDAAVAWAKGLDTGARADDVDDVNYV